ncbi:DUF6046 domain-containing protein [Pseudotamlana carrageenivorans]|uniref:DUF6046 domain-containing protein n=1 Tax=Pseudotamlana carrageenivorans TaxID=2069432 RepID=A0A2I7SKS1_9FLAO|nr:DUF6046 domain-containing protein [Tamlana carrageenivorans]AUS06483.1 hypothetical protein C1A40_13970 [Tamlana carrageenivorans]
MAEFDIKELVAKAHFDYVGPAFPQWWGKNKTAFVIPNLENVSAAYLNGHTPYFMPVKLLYNGQTFTLPNEPLVGLSLAKTIVETATVGKHRKGTVKEYITTEDYQISFRGVCFDEDNMEAYPAIEVKNLNRLFEINEAIEVIDNPFFELFGIRSIVLKDIQFDEMAGQLGMQRYVITAVSDQDFYADLSEQKIINVLS